MLSLLRPFLLMNAILVYQRTAITKAFTPSSHHRRFVSTTAATIVSSPSSVIVSAKTHLTSNPFTSQQTASRRPLHRCNRNRHFSTPIDTEENATMSTAADPGTQTISYQIEMTESERYLFDLNGYIIIRNVLTSEEIYEVNSIIDKHQEGMIERKDTELRNAIEGTKFYGSGPGRKDLGGVLEWGPDSKIFKSILAHPRLVPLFHGILGKGYRMDHLPFIIAQDKGAEGFQLHGGTVDCNSGEYNPELAYTCHNGNIRSALLGCNVMLTDHDPGFGGFCVVPGSHKSNFKMPPGMVDGEQHSEFIQQPATKAGDVVLFSEGTVHGAMAWTQEKQRRVCLYRFSPATNVYGRSYFSDGGKWPEKMYDDLNDAQMAVLEPPYANRLDRPEILEDCENVQYSSRNVRKKQHDRELFGTKYF